MIRFTRDTIHAQAHGVGLYVQLGTWTLELGRRCRRGLRLVWKRGRRPYAKLRAFSLAVVVLAVSLLASCSEKHHDHLLGPGVVITDTTGNCHGHDHANGKKHCRRDSTRTP